MNDDQHDHSISVSCVTEYPEYAANEKAKFWGLVTLKASHYEPEESKRPSLDIVAVIDKSGSMRGEKLFLVKKSLEFLVQNLVEKDRLCVITYDSHVSISFELLAMNSESKDFAKQKIAEIVDGTSTNLCAGLLQGLCEILGRKNKNDVASVLLFTDGLANVGITDKSSIMKAMSNPRKYLNAKEAPVVLFGHYQSRPTQPLQCSNIAPEVQVQFPVQQSSGQQFPVHQSSEPQLQVNQSTEPRLPPIIQQFSEAQLPEPEHPEPMLSIQQSSTQQSSEPQLPVEQSSEPQRQAEQSSESQLLEEQCSKPQLPEQQSSIQQCSEPQLPVQQSPVQQSLEPQLQEQQSTVHESPKPQMPDFQLSAPPLPVQHSPEPELPVQQSTVQQSPVQQSQLSATGSKSHSPTSSSFLSRFLSVFRSKPAAHSSSNEVLRFPAEKLEQEEKVKVDIDASVYTFGFGSDHDPHLLKAISDAANGMYFYIENEEQISESFGHCFGGLVSTLGQNIKLKLELCDGVIVDTIHTHKNYSSDDSLRSWQINLGDMQSDEQRDVLLTLNLSPTKSSSNPITILKSSISYFCVVDSTYKHSEGEMTTVRSDEAQHSPEVAEPAVDRQRNRILTTKAIKEALQMADEGNFDLARKRLNQEIERVKNSLTGKDEFCKLLVKDLERSLRGLKDRQSYISAGKKSQMNLLQMHSNQRSNRASKNSYASVSNMSYQAKFK